MKHAWPRAPVIRTSPFLPTGRNISELNVRSNLLGVTCGILVSRCEEPAAGELPHRGHIRTGLFMSPTVDNSMKGHARPGQFFVFLS